MDRMNFNSYDHFHYYNQPYQADGQHTFHPETGQTSNGVAASGASWSYPEQSYQNFNYPEYIPPLHGSDREYSLQSPQSSASGNSIESEVPLSPSNAQPAAQNFNFPDYIPPLHGSDREYFQQSPQSMVLEDTVQNAASLAPFNAQPAVQNFNFPDYIPPLHGSNWEYLQQSPQPMVLEDTVQNDASLAPSNAQSAAQNFNFPDYIPPLHGSDWEYLQQSTQPEDTVQNDAFLAPSNLQPATAPRSRKGMPPVKERFLASLEAFAQGFDLKDCSSSLKLSNYIKDDGSMTYKLGTDLYRQFADEDKELLRQAIINRQESKSTKDLVKIGFLAGLDNYAQGVPLSDCSETLGFRFYVSNDGKLHKHGEALRARLSPEDQDRVNAALVARRRKVVEELSGDLPYFMTALKPYGEGLDLKACANQPGLQGKERYQKVVRYLTREGGLTAKGELLIENLPPTQQNFVLYRLEQRRQHMQQTTQVQESLQQQPEMPASMPEMGGMDPTAMYTPVQTETMMVSAWQYTGQAMPGIWGIPSESAEPSIPSYNLNP
jgi:hypothetical protein